jgi:signal transduction histidine kinase
VTLLENALAYGSGQVDMVVLRMGAQTIVQVWDHGPGLPSEEHLRRLGTPFQRFREGEAQGFRREGQGLGLSLLMQMAQQEGWGLEFRNHPGKGFEVLLELPA